MNGHGMYGTYVGYEQMTGKQYPSGAVMEQQMGLAGGVNEIEMRMGQAGGVAPIDMRMAHAQVQDVSFFCTQNAFSTDVANTAGRRTLFRQHAQRRWRRRAQYAHGSRTRN